MYTDSKSEMLKDLQSFGFDLEGLFCFAFELCFAIETVIGEEEFTNEETYEVAVTLSMMAKIGCSLSEDNPALYRMFYAIEMKAARFCSLLKELTTDTAPTQGSWSLN